ncbi:MAG: hypothetical protein HKO66_05875 [Saprospiraceae bacterium]|nr:hypothetical protein [Bacteroidia bacterium]NNE14365.1 hypothetical protein [Saprospiraceae bacterium]NNL91739.1 hypothetical protein [Saprospiraceae bacterium]
MLKKIAFFLIFFIPLVAFCQPKDNSPYSRFGIGDIVDRNFMSSQFMGGLGASYKDPFQINIVNPASLSYLSSTTFDIGVFAENSGLRDGVSTDNPQPSEYQNIWKGNLSYLSLAIPLQNKLNDVLDRKERNISLATAFTLMPYSTVGYNVKIDEFDDDIGEIKKKFEGSGGTYQFVWSNGIRYKQLAFGLNLGYLFGNLDYLRRVEFEQSAPFFETELRETNRLKGFLWNAGAMYTFKLNGENINNDVNFVPKRLTIGIHGNSKTGFNNRSTAFEGSIQNVSGILDSLNSTSEIMESTGKLPSELGLGATYYHGSKYALGFNYSTTKWSQFESSFVNNKLNNIKKLSFGGYYRPNYNSIGSYFERVYYRFGLYVNEVPNEIPQNSNEIIRDIGVSVGFGFPFFYQRKISHANLGVTLGMLGKGTAVEERYVKLSFSFTFNDDEWLIKRKYN